MIDAIRETARFVHIGGGFVVLTLFWCQILRRKGDNWHRIAGRLYYAVGQLVAGLALFNVVLITARALLRGETLRLEEGSFAALMLLGFLAIFTSTMLERGRTAVQNRGPQQGRRRAVWLTLACLPAIAGATLLAYVLRFQPPNGVLLGIFAPFGVVLTVEIFHFQLRTGRRAQEWLCDHLDGMLGSGIAFHTAFFVFGASPFFNPLFADSSLKIVPWVLPFALGWPATLYLKRRIRRSANSLTANQHHEPAKHPAGTP